MKTILIVEDDKDERSVLTDILNAEGFEVVGAEEGKEALALLDKQKIDLIITDRAMPGMGGMELLQKLREKKCALPIIVLSAYGEEGLWGEAIGLGARDYLVKPFSPEDVLKLIREHLSGGKQ